MSASIEQGARPSRGLRLPPAVVSLAIQAAAFAAGIGLWHAARAAHLPVSLPVLSVAQGLIAAGLSWRCRQAPWWPLLHFLFPVATIAAQGMQLPATLFLAVFLLLAGVFRAAYRTQVPYYPSGAAARRDVLAALPAGRLRFIDIGSGTGGLTMHLAARRPESDFTGIEIAPFPWLASLLRNRLAALPVNFVRGDYRVLDLSRYDVVFAYLAPPAMPALWQKAKKEMRRDALLLSYEFAIPGVCPDFAGPPDARGRRLYGWRMGSEAAHDSHPPTAASQVFSWRAVMQEEPVKALLRARARGLFPRRRQFGAAGQTTAHQRGRAC